MKIPLKLIRLRFAVFSCPVTNFEYPTITKRWKIKLLSKTESLVFFVVRIYNYIIPGKGLYSTYFSNFTINSGNLNCVLAKLEQGFSILELVLKYGIFSHLFFCMVNNYFWGPSAFLWVSFPSQKLHGAFAGWDFIIILLRESWEQITFNGG